MNYYSAWRFTTNIPSNKLTAFHSVYDFHCFVSWIDRKEIKSIGVKRKIEIGKLTDRWRVVAEFSAFFTIFTCGLIQTGLLSIAYKYLQRIKYFGWLLDGAPIDFF